MIHMTRNAICVQNPPRKPTLNPPPQKELIPELLTFRPRPSPACHHNPTPLTATTTTAPPRGSTDAEYICTNCMKYSTFNEDFLIKRRGKKRKKKRKLADGQLTRRRVRVAAGGDEDACEGRGEGGEEGRPRSSPQLCCIKSVESVAANANAAGAAPLLCFYLIFLDVL